MPRLDELELAYLPMEEPAFSADPFPHLKAARQQHPWRLDPVANRSNAPVPGSPGRVHRRLAAN